MPQPNEVAMAQDQFAAAVNDSHLLLAFLSRRSLSMDERDRRTFKSYADAMARVQAQVAAKAAVSESDRAAFWESFIWLSNLASPATIESIRYYFNYYYQKREPIWVTLWQCFVRPQQRATSGGRWVFSVFTIVTFLATLFLSLAGFVGNRTLEQFSKDYRHWYTVATIARSLNYGYSVDAQLDKNDRDVTLLLRPPADPAATEAASYRIAQLSAGGATVAGPAVAPAAGETAATAVTALNQLHIPEDRVLQILSAFPQIFSSGSTIKRLDDWVWTPACLQPAYGELQLPAGRNPLAPCVRVRDVILAEELTTTLTGMNTEREILEWLLTPVGWLDRRARPADPGEVSSKPQGTVLQPMASDSGNARCPPLPTHLPDRATQKSVVQDPLSMNRIFLTIVCRQLPMPTVLPPPLQNMLDMPFRAQLTLDALNTYVLALLFGLLGASVHVMRDIHRRLDDFTLTRVLLSRYKTRLILGAVAGPFIGLFINPLEGVTSSLNATPQLTNHLAGLALAFIAGFSVEVLFSTLDRFTALVSAVASGVQGAQTTLSQRGSGARLH
jgi:hypothetical protein